ncbi:TetR/AcrR family transcriptional regulator [Actinomadura harenae]|uniref:TetR/AcrR family transcriptional regulator n=1 Tax=Actinomadura harenae TaxID=2483351 RepID=A0A3M2L495_9ACTN|nr:TetR/AcrR family transcriptional regulator [Actinomadura harenae]RMI32499.1 TetR/AcrR family transcriptional regulator [Actinomadura harenae]
MSPRRADPNVRPALIEVGARLLAEEGPTALSARRVAGEAGCSTMAVYTHFGGMSGLVREMVHVGFTRLKKCFLQVAETDDPVADMALLGRAYRRNGHENPHLYAVMFGASSLASFSLSESDRQHGRYTLAGVARCAERCIDAGRFADDDPMLVANQMWIAVHGAVALELGGYLVEPYDADQCFETQLSGLMVSAGDAREDAERSVRVSRERLDRELGDPLGVA